VGKVSRYVIPSKGLDIRLAKRPKPKSWVPMLPPVAPFLPTCRVRKLMHVVVWNEASGPYASGAEGKTIWKSDVIVTGCIAKSDRIART
jgi:hypothetical protein